MGNFLNVPNGLITQLLTGSALASGDLTLSASTNATKGWVRINDNSGLLFDGDPSNPIEPELVGNAYSTIWFAGDDNFFGGPTIAYSGAGGPFGGAAISTVASRGTFASPSNMQTGDSIFLLATHVWNNSPVNYNLGQSNVGFIAFRATENHNASAIGTSLEFQITPNGSTTPFISLLLAGSLASLATDLDLTSHQIHNVADPTSSQDVATKAFVLANAGSSFPLLAPAGSSSAPSYSFTGRTNCGLYSRAANVTNIAAQGFNIAQFDLATGSQTITIGPENTGGSMAMIFGGNANAPYIIAASGGTTLGLMAKAGQHVAIGIEGTSIGNTLQIYGGSTPEVFLQGHLVLPDNLYDIGSDTNTTPGANRPRNVSIGTGLYVASKIALGAKTEVTYAPVTNSTTSLATIVTIILPTDTSTYLVRAKIVGRKSDGSKHAVFEIVGNFDREGAGSSQNGATLSVVSLNTDDASYAVAFSLNGNNVDVQANGNSLVAETVHWQVISEIIQVS